MKKNNKGSAFVMVLVITAIVGILAAIALWVSLVNYQMKITDIKVKNNFYSAESVLDQICVGLQEDVSEAYKHANGIVMVNYSILNDEQRKGIFSTEYKRELKKRLKKDSDEMSYNLSKLTGYVYPELFGSDPAKPHVDIVAYLDDNTVSTEKGSMVVYESNIVLKGIEVTFTDQEGFTSVIKTDISLEIPDLEMVSSKGVPDTMAFSIVGNNGIEFEGSQTSVKGNVYAGKGGLDKDVSLDIGSNNVTFSDLQYLLSNGTTRVKVGKILSVSERSDFWTNNIQIQDGATAVLQGNTMVADDLTLEGSKPKVYLGPRKDDLSSEGRVGGRYVGFGNKDTDASQSSSIILNGKDSLLDMSSLNELILGGWSYVNTSKIDASKDGKNNNNIAMGESIAVKGSQITYLIPPECICVNQDGVSLYNSNPITYDNYQEALKPNVKEVDVTKVSTKLGKAIRDYFTPGTETENMISRVFDPDNKLVYYYINLTPEVAAKYNFDYNSNANLDKLNLYTDYYADEIKIGESSSLICTAGNYTRYVSGKSLLVSNPNKELQEYLLGYSDKYQSLMKTLSTKELTTEDGTKKDVFDYLIDESKLAELLNGKDTLEVIFERKNGTKYKAVLTSKDYTYDATMEEDGTQIILIVSQGTVNIRKNFKGTVIAKKKVEVKADAIDKGDAGIMESILQKPVTEDLAVFHIFRAGQDFVVGSAGSGEDDNTIKMPYSDIITYQNWQMK